MNKLKLLVKQGRQLATSPSNNGHRSLDVCVVGLNGHRKNESQIMKTPPASKRAMNRIRKLGGLKVVKRPPSEEEIVEVEEKILRGNALAEHELAEVMAILKRFSRLGRIVRTLAQTSQGATAFAIQHLVSQTVENTACLEKLPAKKLSYFAACRTQFPMLISRRTSSRKMRERFQEVGLGSDLGPGYNPNSRWRRDAFADFAEEMLIEVFCGRPPDLNLDQWNEVWPEVHPLVDEYLDTEPAALEYLKSFVTTPGDRKTTSRWKERVVENIRNKMRILCGVKAAH